jgi:uncharacterized protein YjdB
VGQTVTIPVVGYAANTASGKVKASWTASKSAVASLAKGKRSGSLAIPTGGTVKLKVKGYRAGKSVIQVKTATGAKAKITVTVTKKAVKTAKVRITGATKALAVGRSGVLKAKVTSAKATAAVPTWRSSKPAVATVDAAGVVTAKAKGKTTITVKVRGQSAKRTITVK